MSEPKDKVDTEQPLLSSQFVTLTVERSKEGLPRLVLDGPYMAVSGFVPGDTIEAIIQPSLISILHTG